jgi:hypothetical protein
MTSLNKIGSLFRGRGFSIHVYAPAPLVHERLLRFIATGRPKPHSEFEYTAELSGDEFCLERAKQYWKQWPPVLVGRISQQDGYTEASGFAQLSSAVVRDYLLLVGATLVLTVVGCFQSGGEASALGLFLFPVVAALFFGAFFKLSALSHARNWSDDIASLERILETEIHDDA